jgi:translocation and assembly module TamB
MEIKQRKKRRLLRCLLGLTVTGILLLGLVPVWFPWVLAPVASRYGVAFGDYHRTGWTRFALTDVRGAWNGTRLEVQRVEAVLPTTWLWQRLQTGTKSPPLLTVSGGRLLIADATTNAVSAIAARKGTTGGTLNDISQIGRKLQQWLPVVELTNCTIQWASHHVSIPRAEWRDGQLRAAAQVPALRGEVELAARWDGTQALQLTADWPAGEAALRGGFFRTNDGWSWNGELGWRTNRAALTARFTTNGWWPAQAQLDGRDWQIPAGFLQLEGYENLVASLSANLVSNRFDLQATGFVEPSAAARQSGWPAVNVSLGANGDPTGVKLHTFNIQSPGLRARLTNTVGITPTGELLAEPAQLHIALDLAKFPGAALAGKAEGLVQIEPQGSQPPEVQFRFSAEQVRAGNWDIKTILVRGGFNAPLLKLDELRVELADGAVLVGGVYDAAARAIVGGRWKLSGGFLQKILPDLSYAELIASGELDGPLTNLAHHGEAAFTDFHVAGLKPLQISATWHGRNQRLESAELELTAGESVLSLGATAEFDASKREVAATLNRLSLRRAAKLYALQQPCAITFRAGPTNATAAPWTLAVAAFDWRGAGRMLSATADFAGPSHGAATLTMTNVAFADFSDFFEADLANILIADLTATAQWSNGPVQAVISGAGSLTNRTGQVFGLRGNVQAGDLLMLDLSAVAGGYTPTLSVTGTIPITVIPDRGAGWLVWDKSQRVALTGSWKDDQAEIFSIPLGAWGQVEVLRPEVQFTASGSFEEPSVELTANAAKLDWQSPTNDAPRPKLEDLQLVVEIRPDAIRLKTFAAKLDGQPLRATGEWLLPAEAWREWWSTRKLPDWNQAQGHLELAEAQVAALAAYLPELLAPEGRLSATLDLKTGKQLQGVLSLTNAATRAMGPITPLRDIAALVRFDGQRAELQSFRAQIGGQPIRADGFVTIPERDGSGLDYHVNLSGTNVPLARSAELLLRGDFAVSLRGGSKQPTLLSGAVTLRDGLYVQHASALVWSAPHRPEWRPPYFSVTNAPFADWKVELAVRGNRFLRIRTPVFSSIASADFQLRGSLRAPVLTGDARVNSGRLIFPFGALRIDQGIASFSGNDPLGPDLQINASGRNYRYDLRLEVKGAADGAAISFSSTPPLSSEQILLMLTAGEIPQSDYAFSDSARAGRLVTFLGQDLLSRYLGSDPAKERLIIQTGESISEAGRLTYSVEYRLTDRWSIIGEYDEFNAFNTDLKWKVFNR